MARRMGDKSGKMGGGGAVEEQEAITVGVRLECSRGSEGKEDCLTHGTVGRCSRSTHPGFPG